MGSAVLKGGRSAYIHEFCFQADKRSDMDCVELQGVQFADSQEWDLMLRNFPARGSICSCWGIAFSRCETSIYGQCSPAIKLIC